MPIPQRRACNICGEYFIRSSNTGQILCPACRPNGKDLGLDRKYTRDTRFIVNKWYSEYRRKGISSEKTITKIAKILNRSENSVKNALYPENII